ncbi:PadR family transcriptional regulator [Streptomyces sp. SID685]|uniref:PadR family transcriptional regulator n=1 Tax=Streptomyces TaxID=1883 RepID=UPI00136CFA3E|nr:PadR family transcriptional regulator [Streptomyces sp. SID685]MYR87998.1 PadR family transcriptional regulator [Streptomyces sp. SID685]
MADLPSSAYVVLGLLAEQETATPYQLDQLILRGIGNFWSFPRSQLYAEAGRLARHGLIIEQREESGRRRRTLAITEAGRRQLRAWLETPTDAPAEVHDPGVLRLYFQPVGHDRGEGHSAAVTQAVLRLAAEQIATHEKLLAVYRQNAEVPTMRPGSPQRAALELGLRYEQLLIDFWKEVLDSPTNLPGGSFGGPGDE